MFITHAKTDRDVRLPVEMLGKPRSMKWEEYCVRLSRQLKEMNAGADIPLTIHLDRVDYEGVCREIDAMTSERTLDVYRSMGITRARNVMMSGITLTFDIPEFI